jgi:radical SAM superfamily enzyme YgiQ (UPF0313 family)
MITLINHQGLKLVKGIQIQTPSPSIGLAYLGAYLKKHNHSYTAIDACGEALDQILPSSWGSDIKIQGLTTEQVIERIPSNTRIFGFSCLFSHVWPLVLSLASEIRKSFPNALFVAGGEHPTAMPAQVLAKGTFDVVVLGEGEETFLELVEKFKANHTWHDITGIGYLDKNQKYIVNPSRKRVGDIDNLPYPDWDPWCIAEYINHQQVTGINLGRSMPILGSRGCPYTCTFCSNEEMWTRKYSMRDGEKLAQEMQYMKEKYNVTGFTFMDSTFIINRRKTLEFCQALIKKKLNVSYQLPAGTRCEAFDEELVLALERSGLKNFALAPESGSEMIRNVIKKEINIDSFMHTVKIILRKTQMTIGCFIVIGFPEDTPQTMKESLQLVRKLALLGVDDVTVSKFTPYPGSPYFHQLVEEGKLSDNHDDLANIISFYSDNSRSHAKSLSPKSLHYWMIWMFLNFYIISFVARPLKVLKNFRDYFSKGVENARYMRFISEIFVLRKKWKKN